MSKMNGHASYEIAYSHVELEKPSETNVHGRRGGCIVFIISFLIVFSVCNLMVTIVLVDFIRRMPASEPPKLTVDGLGRPLEPVTVNGVEGDVLSISDPDTGLRIESGDKISVSGNRGKSSVNLKSNEELEFVSESGVVTTDRQGQNLLYDLDQLDANIITNFSKIQLEGLYVPRIVNFMHRGLRLESRQALFIQGMHGVSVRGGKMVFSADEDLLLKSRGRDLIMEAVEGIYFDRVRSIPTVKDADETAVRAQSLCICGSSGRVFAVPLKAKGFTCGNANEQEDPCSVPSY